MELSTCISICRWIFMKNTTVKIFWKQNFWRNFKRAGYLLLPQPFTSRIATCLRTLYVLPSIKLRDCMPKQQHRSGSRFAKIFAKFRRRTKAAESDFSSRWRASSPWALTCISCACFTNWVYAQSDLLTHGPTQRDTVEFSQQAARPRRVLPHSDASYWLSARGLASLLISLTSIQPASRRFSPAQQRHLLCRTRMYAGITISSAILVTNRLR